MIKEFQIGKLYKSLFTEEIAVVTEIEKYKKNSVCWITFIKEPDKKYGIELYGANIQRVLRDWEEV